MHALVIEDEFLVALNIEDSLEMLGFASSETVTTEEEAVAAARRRVPDLITSDVRLLRGTGIAAVRAILRDQCVPVVFITGNAEAVMEEMPDAVVIQKPYRDEALRLAITTARSKSELHQTGRGTLPDADQFAEQRPAVTSAIQAWP
jgi:two-component system, response regulator PdtaR